MPLIRDTIDPTNEREVPDEEYLDLERMGVLLTGTRAHTADGLRKAAVRQLSGDAEPDAPAGPGVAVGIGEPGPAADNNVGTDGDTAGDDADGDSEG